ncbi:MAG TPA: DUF3822 family protein [Flavisolibacter sp.]|nr:DUF3822 family protein [Flavisolibacter sp.]
MNLVFQTEETSGKRGNILLCEWGAAHCCTAWFNAELNVLSHLKYVSFEMLNEEAIQNVIDTLFSHSVDAEKVVACSAFPQAVLTPARLYKREDAVIAALYGARFAPQFTDAINEWQLINVFALPAPITRKLEENCPAVIFTQVFTPELKAHHESNAENQITINFTPKHFRVVVKRSGQLQLAQIYFYSAPLDVVYYLLKIFEELELDKENTQIILSGLIEKSSALFTELQNYFVVVGFAGPAAIAVAGSQHPQHFFTSLSNLAACVS